MYDTFMKGQDLYSEIASKAFNLSYEECLEHFPKGAFIKQVDGKWVYGSENDYEKIADGENDIYKAGKARRTQAKSVLLGVLYGRGEASIGEQLGCTTEKAKEIKESVFRGFPAIKQFEQTSLDMAKELGYVTTVCGRKRRLPDLQLEEYEFRWKDGKCPYDDPLDFTMTESLPVPDERQMYYRSKFANARYFRDRQKVNAEAEREGIQVINNGKKISDATRQCVNARIQGSAADLTKLAMIKLSENEQLNELGFRMLIPVHDEIIAECPEEHAEECAKLLAQTMCEAAETILEMSIKCDVEVTKVWYGEPIDGKEKKIGESNTAREFENELSESDA